MVRSSSLGWDDRGRLPYGLEGSPDVFDGWLSRHYRFDRRIPGPDHLEIYRLAEVPADPASRLP